MRLVRLAPSVPVRAVRSSSHEAEPDRSCGTVDDPANIVEFFHAFNRALLVVALHIKRATTPYDTLHPPSRTPGPAALASGQAENARASVVRQPKPKGGRPRGRRTRYGVRSLIERVLAESPTLDPAATWDAIVDRGHAQELGGQLELSNGKPVTWHSFETAFYEVRRQMAERDSEL